MFTIVNSDLMVDVQGDLPNPGDWSVTATRAGVIVVEGHGDECIFTVHLTPGNGFNCIYALIVHEYVGVGMKTHSKIFQGPDRQNKAADWANETLRRLMPTGGLE